MTKVPAQRRRTQAERSEEMRLRLARAAFEIIAELGISSLRTAAVVERVGVSQGALLHHFLNKEELTLAAVDYSLAEEMKRSLAAAARVASGSRDAVFAAMIEDFRQFFLHERFWAALDTTMDSGRDKQLKIRVTQIVASYRQPVYNSWTGVLRQAGLSDAAAADAVIMTAALVSGMALRSLWQDVSGLLDQTLATWSEIMRDKWPV